jgi:ribosomal protein L2
MSPKPIDLRRVQHGLARLDALLRVHPELREPEAQARLTAWLEQEQRTVAQEKRTRTQTGDMKTRVRMQRLREERKQAGMKAYELWLDPETAAVLAQLKHPRESLTHVIRRAVLTLKAQDMPEPAQASVERPARGQGH